MGFFIMCRIAYYPPGLEDYFYRDCIVDMLTRLENSRGGDGNGFYFVRTDKIRKSVRTPINRLMKKSAWKGGFLFHTRLATHGNKSRRNSHPFRLIDGSAMVHNGVWAGYASYKDVYYSKSDTDSEVLGNHIINGYRELSGSNAVLIYDPNSHKLKILKQKFADLVVCETNGYYWIQSEPPIEQYIDKSWEIEPGYYEITDDQIRLLPEKKSVYYQYQYTNYYSKPPYDDVSSYDWYWGD